jgi:hypothetical protein
MKTSVVALCLVLAWAPAAYVRREWVAPGTVAYLVVGSRDRRLHGKDRRRARKAAA